MNQYKIKQNLVNFIEFHKNALQYCGWMDLPAGPAWSITGQKTLSNINKYHSISPGPIYNISGVGYTCIGYSHPKSARFINNNNRHYPSSVEYCPKQIGNTAPKISFGQQPKFQDINNINPGPNVYNYNISCIKGNGPNFTFGQKCDNLMITAIPGPGQYDSYEQIPHTRTKNKPKFTSSSRFSQQNLMIPGIGKYNIMKTLINNKGSFSKQSKDINFDNKIPGRMLLDKLAGTYKQISSFVVSQNYHGKSFGNRTNGKNNYNKDTVNAFHNYFREIKGKNTHARSFSLPQSKRFLLTNQNYPGPSDYRPLTSEINKNSKISTPGGPLHIKKSNTKNPGPGSYNINTNIARSTQYSFPRSKSTVITNTNPGVGKYHPDQQNKFGKSNGQQSCNMMGKSSRTNFIIHNKVGVGQYHIKEEKKQGISFGKANRFGEDRNRRTPGYYHMHSTLGNYNLYWKKKN